MGKSLSMSSNGMDFDQFMKALVSVPKERIEKKAKTRKAKRGTLSPAVKKR
jgi:hypothetical protein